MALQPYTTASSTDVAYRMEFYEASLMGGPLNMPQKNTSDVQKNTFNMMPSVATLLNPGGIPMKPSPTLLDWMV